MVKDNWTECQNCGFPALHSQFKRCPVYSHSSCLYVHAQHVKLLKKLFFHMPPSSFNLHILHVHMHVDVLLLIGFKMYNRVTFMPVDSQLIFIINYLIVL